MQEFPHQALPYSYRIDGRSNCPARFAGCHCSTRTRPLTIRGRARVWDSGWPCRRAGYVARIPRVALSGLVDP